MSHFLVYPVTSDNNEVNTKYILFHTVLIYGEVERAPEVPFQIVSCLSREAVGAGTR